MSNISCEEKINKTNNSSLDITKQVVTVCRSLLCSNKNLDVSETGEELVHPGEGVGGVKFPPAGTLVLGEVRVHPRSVLFEAISEEARVEGNVFTI